MLTLLIWGPGSLFAAAAYLLRARVRRPLHLLLAIGVGLLVWMGTFFVASYFLVELGYGEQWARHLATILFQTFWAGAICYWLLRRKIKSEVASV